MTFTFSGNDDVTAAASLTFKCSIDGALFSTCASPLLFTGLSVATHTFEVKAIDLAGNTDPTAASFSWEVITLSIGVPGDVTPNPDGSTTVTGTDGSGNEAVTVTLPPGTSTDGGTLDLTVIINGQNTAAEITGSSVPPPGKTMKIKSNAGSNFVCIVDTPTKVSVVGLPNCGSTDLSISQVVMACDGTTQTFSGFPDTPTSRVYTCNKTTEMGKTFMTVDGLAFSFIMDAGDSDGILDADDVCPFTFGFIEFNGCPVADKNNVFLHTVNLGGGGSSKVPLADAEVRVFDRNDATFQAEHGTKNPSGTIYGQVFESDAGLISTCTTDSTGMCIAGETAVGDYLVIVKKTFDLGDQGIKQVYTGLPKSPSDFENGLATKDFQIIKKIKKNGDVSFGGGKKVVVLGSILEVIYQDVAIWEPGVTSYIYPYIFTSDSSWTTDLCMYLPIGYEIVGVFDELGNLVTNEGCVQTFVAGETKVAAFEVVDIGSPKEFQVVVDLDAKEKKKPTKVTLITDTKNDNAGGAKGDDKQEDKGQNKKQDKQQDKGQNKN